MLIIQLVPYCALMEKHDSLNWNRGISRWLIAAVTVGSEQGQGGRKDRVPGGVKRLPTSFWVKESVRLMRWSGLPRLPRKMATGNRRSTPGKASCPTCTQSQRL